MIRIGEFIFDTEQARLVCQEKEIALEPKLFELLLLFVNQPNTIISRQDILEHLWPGSLVTDNAINKLVASLRKVLTDDPKSPRYIQTIPKRGYRLICQVSVLDSSQAGGKSHLVNEESNAENKQQDHVRTKIVSAVLISFLLLFGSVFLWQVFSDNDKQAHHNQFTKALTRAHGMEESARMHPDNTHLYYLKQREQQHAKNTQFQLWIKNIHTAQTQQVETGKTNISKIIAVITQPDSVMTTLFYLDKQRGSCRVYQATLIAVHQSNSINNTMQWQQDVEKLFDCSDKRLKDVDYHADKKMLYYTAQPQNFWPNQIYAFDLDTKKHSFVTQTEPVGWGHHNIDISPDGNKLLIMSTTSDIKTQLQVLNLHTNEITAGMKFDYLVTEAIWHHNSEHVYYFAAPPAHQIINSDIQGHNATAVVNVSEYLSPQMSLFPDGKNLLFSTKQNNYGISWLVAPKSINEKTNINIDNSTVDDFNPALFHQSSKYLFISNRSGRAQLYLASEGSKQAEIVTNFSQSYHLSYMAISADDKNLLMNVGNNVYLIAMRELNEHTPLTTLKKEQLIFSSDNPIISIDWLSSNGVAITAVRNGIPELKVVNLLSRKAQQLNGNWAYGMTDSQHPEYHYLIEQQTNNVYRINSLTFSDDPMEKLQHLTNTQITLPNHFFHVKIDNNVLCYGNEENGSVYLHAEPLNTKTQSHKYRLNDFISYDVNNGNIIVSDIESFEGDVHRTMY
ncbi:winged helix-turn-helix domain-containing protein [Thalassotalea sp. 1_MG-2023]|uniref:winged helix-turn-helix domain-containing protein n=1 Tax=Thalassotalea sp. 1_MG-2023 TaxID=3062680 RepID=UPI0026E27C5A|nr:winged helix-turn-helix domain-containing protein [Thalassotalea sp. 1_MG-2023]MDO6425740.1 winged helix-turn-helix domain-containing protein [Thalassotalea sp. 1_MG-2023]